MAISRRKSSGAKSGSFKRKKMGKGWSTLRKEPIGTRPVLKITEVPDDGKQPRDGKKGDGQNTDANKE